MTFVRKALKGALAHFGYGAFPRATIPMNRRQMRHLLGLADLFARIEGIRGSVVECGVGKGRSFLQFAHLILEEGGARDLWGFDSFEGFPPPTVEDASARMPKAGEWSGTSPEDIREILRTGSMERSFIEKQVHLVPGFFNKTLNSYNGGPIAFLHIDADLYESYIDALTTLVPHVAKGGVVLFDEYQYDKWPGATKAIDEFMSQSPWQLAHHEPANLWYFVKTS